MGNTIPSQVRSVDPYASYNSDVVNKITRIVSDGKNILLAPSPITVIQLNSENIRAETGKAIMQDVLIEIQDFNIAMNDADFYIDSSGGVFNETGYYLVVLHYEYQKTSPAPEASIKIIMPSQKIPLYNSSKHLFLGALDISDPGGGEQIDDVLDYDPDNPSINRDSVTAGASTGNFVATDSNTTGVGNGLYSIGSGSADKFDEIWCTTLNATTVNGSVTSSKYADLAEKYSYDPNRPLEIGTVMKMSVGEYEVEVCDDEMSPIVVGIVSLTPGFIMNNDLKNSEAIALVGRVPVKVVGSVIKTDVLVSAGDGCLRVAKNSAEYMFKVGIALETNLDEGIKLTECFIK